MVYREYNVHYYAQKTTAAGYVAQNLAAVSGTDERSEALR